MKTTVRLISFCLLLGATSLHAEMQLYEVGFQYRQEVYAALAAILESDQPGKDSHGEVELLPTGQILVDTNDETHKQIARVIAAIAEQAKEPPPSITLRYWALYGGATSTSIDSSALEILRPVLDDLKKIHGELKFEVLDSLSLLSETGSEAELRGRRLHVLQTTYYNQERLTAIIDLAYKWTSSARSGTQTLNVKTALKRGEFLVLGESTIENGEDVGQMFYVIAWL